MKNTRYKGYIEIMLSFIVALFHVQQVIAQGCYVFIGSYNWHKAKAGIYVYKLDTVSGDMKRISAVRHILNPAYITLAPDGQHIYACTEAQIPGGGKVSSFAFNAGQGALSFINEQESGGENPVYLTVHKNGKWLVNANYTGGSVAVYPLDTNGSIAPAAQVITFSDSSINKERQDCAHIHAAVFSPNEDYIFLPDLGADKIRCFAFDTAIARPLQPAAYPNTIAVPGSGPRHFTFHPNGKFCYCVEEMGGMITAYSYDNGKLNKLQRLPTHDSSLKDGYSDADIHISPDGLFLYASNRGDENNIAIFSIDQATGLLTPAGYQSTLGDHPRNFVIDPSGKFLLVANQISGDVIVFKRDKKTGLLQETGVKIQIPGASCLQVKNYIH